MKHALFAVLPELGHIHPFLGAAEALARRDVRVSFWAPRDVRRALAPHGFSEVHAPEGAPPPASEHRGAAFTELLADERRLRAWIRAMLVDGAEPLVAPIRAHLREHRPDVVVIDPMLYAAAIAAHEEGIPWLGLSTSLNPCIADDVDSELVRTLRALDPARHALFRAHGMSARFRVSDVLSPQGTFVLSTNALLGEHLPHDGVPVHLVGAALPRATAPIEAVDANDARPLVYVSFGSQAYHQPLRLASVLAAAREVDARFVVAMGELADSELARSAPTNVRVTPFAAQVELLRHASAIVTHGGANSVHEALAHGVPLVVSPICNDQPHNAARVLAAGCGRVVDLATAPPGDVVAALRDLVREEAPERARARAIARSYAEAGGSERIADVVSSTFTTLLGAERGSPRGERG
ncbi:MAG: glycosyltransferase family 1 protein [Deltaproteobacteria bacterium]|nr:glycosyltransferase family 1 protein [Deltaproteobacteria bacterium]